jgi:hypothetical protein
MGTMWPPAMVERKSKCFSSSWWPIEREPATLDDDGELIRHGRPIRFVLLQKSELMQLAQTGRVAMAEGVVEL